MNLKAQGIPAATNFVLEHPEPAVLQTYFVQEMLARGFLATDRFYATCAHGEAEVEAYLVAVREVFAGLGSALRAGDLRARLKGPVKHTGFGRLN